MATKKATNQPEEKKVELGKKRKVAICAYAESSRMLAPFADKSFEIWGVNELYTVVPRVDVLFELHDYKWLTQKERNPGHLKWLQESKIPIFMLKHYDDIPMSFPFPKDQIVAEFGRYFTNSISWMVALAIKVGFEEIHMYGVDMAADSEYGTQRPSVEYFLGIAVGKGIKIYIPPQSDLLLCSSLYGFEDEGETRMILRLKARKAELAGGMQKLQQAYENAQQQYYHLQGAQENTDYIMRSFMNRPNQKNEGT